MQQAVIGTALDLLEKAWQPRTTVQAPFVWTPDKNAGSVSKPSGKKRRFAKLEASQPCAALTPACLPKTEPDIKPVPPG
jgi:hypothetical protein